METKLGFIALVAVSANLAPYLTRPEIFFGVTVPVDFRDGPVGRSVSRWYRAEIWIPALAVAALVATSPVPLVSGTMLLAQAGGASVAFFNARRKVRPYAIAPTTVREAAIGPPPKLPGGFVAQIGPFLILFGAAVYVGLHWSDIPARFPTHWNLAGRPDDWTTKSAAGVFRGLSLGFVGCSMTLFTSYAVLRWTRLPRVAGVAGQQSRRVRHLNLIAMLGSEYLIAVLLAWTSVVSMFSEPDGQSRLPLPFRVAPFVLIIVGTLAIRTTRRVAASGGPPIGDTTPDSCWLFGRLYFNRADPVLFVEKRMGLRYTLNLGNPVSWLVVIVFLAAVSIPLLLVPEGL